MGAHRRWGESRPIQVARSRACKRMRFFDSYYYVLPGRTYLICDRSVLLCRHWWKPIVVLVATVLPGGVWVATPDAQTQPPRQLGKTEQILEI